MPPTEGTHNFMQIKRFLLFTFLTDGQDFCITCLENKRKELSRL